jgi:hypothetical protein
MVRVAMQTSCALPYQDKERGQHLGQGQEPLIPEIDEEGECSPAIGLPELQLQKRPCPSN